MKKTYNKFRNLKLFFWGIICLYFFNLSGCGLDMFYVLDPPKIIKNSPSYSNIDKLLNYFEFETNETGFNGSFKFLGTDVYYCIYNDYTSMENEYNRIVSLADSETSSSNATDYLLNSTKFSKLSYEGNKFQTLIPYKGSSRIVRIRLTDYQNLKENSALISVANTELGQPLRYGSDKLTFNFGRQKQNPEINKIPESDDVDVKYGNTSKNGVWYVAMFAVAVGCDTTLSDIYSTPLFLGSVSIDSNSEDN